MRCGVPLALLTALVGFLTTAETAAAAWKAGVAKTNITPQQSMWMSGYGSRDHASEGKLTDLWAKVLVWEDDRGVRAALVTLDLVGVDRTTGLAIRERIADQFHIPVANTALMTSHTHTGPVVGTNLKAMYTIDDEQWRLIENYTARLIDEVVAAVGRAIEDLEPATLSWGQGTSDIAVNRRNNREPDVPMLREQGELQGPVDHDVPVLAVKSDDQLKAIVFGYACHATVLSFYQWSGDYPGFAQIELEQQYPGAVAMFWAGCGADQNPLPRRTVELAQEYGARLARSVAAVLGGDMQEITGEFRSAYAEIPLTFAELPTREQLQQTAASSDRFDAGRAKELLEQWEAQGELSKTYPYPVQTWKLGDGPRWIILGGEVVVDYALRFKGEAGGAPVWTAGYANDVMAYIPSLRVLQEGGYEGGGAMRYYGLPSSWTEDVEEQIAAEVERQQ